MRDYRFGNFLRELRKRRGLSQYQLGALVGVSDKAVSKWENGTAKPQSLILYKLSDVLGVTVDELLACRFRFTEYKTVKGILTMKKELWKKAYEKLCERCGNPLPVEVLNRYFSEQAELKDTDMIIYFDLLGKAAALAREKGAHILIKGSTGASFAAFLMGASEINPLKPHYYCPHCQKLKFADGALCGWDLPAKRCACGRYLLCDGLGLPFEAFRPALHGNVNFDLSVPSALWEPVTELIHTYFSDSTVITLIREDRPDLKTIVIIHENISDIMNGQELPFEKHHDRFKRYPTVTLTINEELEAWGKLEAETQTAFQDVPFTDPEILDALRKNDMRGVPEFQSAFVREMLKTVSPASFHDVLQISGLSHGTGVWTGNAETLIKNGMSADRVIAYRDDVFNYIQEKMEAKHLSYTGYAYQITEDARRGLFVKNGVSDELKEQLANLGCEDWFAESLGKIGYLFPKAHGALYVKHSLILLWYKLHYPEVFHKVMFSD